MLRITIQHAVGALTFQLEGTLIGPWVRELKKCWQSALASQPAQAVRVDLTGVTFIDAAGKELLTAMHARGARFICADCLTKSVVAEIDSETTGVALPAGPNADKGNTAQ